MNPPIPPNQNVPNLQPLANVAIRRETVIVKRTWLEVLGEKNYECQLVTAFPPNIEAKYMTTSAGVQAVLRRSILNIARPPSVVLARVFAGRPEILNNPQVPQVPYIRVACPKDFIDKIHKELRVHPNLFTTIKLCYVEESNRVRAGKATAEVLDNRDTLCGAQFVVKNGSNAERYSTVGGLIEVGQTLYGITAGHIACIADAYDSSQISSTEVPLHEWEVHSEDSESTANETLDVPLVIRDTLPVPMKISPDIVHSKVPGPMSVVDLALDAASPVSYEIEIQDTPVQHWYLFEVAEEHRLPNTYFSHAAQNSPVNIVEFALGDILDGPVYMLSARGNVKGHLSNVKHSMFLPPYTHFVEVFRVMFDDPEDPQPGVSGSWIVDAQGGLLIGHVIGGTDRIAYVIPFRETTRSIKEHYGAPVSLPSPFQLLKELVLKDVANGKAISTIHLDHLLSDPVLQAEQDDLVAAFLRRTSNANRADLVTPMLAEGLWDISAVKEQHNKAKSLRSVSLYTHDSIPSPRNQVVEPLVAELTPRILSSKNLEVSHLEHEGQADILEPHNLAFQPLQLNQFRVLKLLPGSEWDTLECSVHVFDWGQSPVYEAISWIWGPRASSNEHNEIRILHDGQSDLCEIRPTFAAALRSFRLDNVSRMLFCDAVCINRRDAAEIASQVRLLPKIFSNAQSTLVWLGEESATSNEALRFIRNSSDVAKMDQYSIDLAYTLDWSAYVDLMRRPWFSRRWIVQEVALSKSVLLYCGSDYVQWSQFCDALYFIEHSLGLSSVNMSASDNFHWRRDLENIHAMSASRLVHIINSLFIKAEDGSIQQRLMSLETLIISLAMLETSSPHDLIYSFLALAKDAQIETQDADPLTMRFKRARMRSSAASKEDDAQIRSQDADPLTMRFKRARMRSSIAFKEEDPGKRLARLVRKAMHTIPPRKVFGVRYDKPFFEVCQNFVGFVIESSGSLDIICRPWIPTEERPTLPSWVQDLSSAPFGRLLNGRMVRINADPLVSDVGSPSRTYHSSRSTVASRIVQPYVENGWGFSGIDRRSPSGHNQSFFANGLIIDQVAESQDMARGGSIPREWFSAFGWDDFRNKAPESLWRLLIADRTADGRYPPQYYPSLLQHVVRNSIAQWGDLDITTALANLGTGHPAMSEFLDRVFSVTFNRRLFRTQGGYWAMGPRDTRLGDAVCVLYGCSVPVILRPKFYYGRDPSVTYYTFVGEAYVHSMMDGQALDLGREIKQFEII